MMEEVVVVVLVITVTVAVTVAVVVPNVEITFPSLDDSLYEFHFISFRHFLIQERLMF